MRNLNHKNRKQRGAALLEYFLIVAGVALVSAAAVSIFGHKVSDMTGAVGAILPGAHADDNNPIVAGKLIETTDSGNGEDSGGNAVNGIVLDIEGIVANNGQRRLGNGMGWDESVNNIGDLVVEAGDGGP